MSSPLLTVAIPTYARLGYLQEAVASAQAQTYPSLEILISDDGANMDLRDWAMAAVATDQRVRYQHTSSRLGLAGNWNFCLQSAGGEYIILIGDDDRLLPDCAERLMGLSAQAEVVFANHYLINGEGVRLEPASLNFTRSSGRAELLPGRLEHPDVAIWKNSLPISSALLRTEVARELGFKEDINTPEIELYLRLATRGGRFIYCPDYLVEYRVHNESATATGLWSDKIAPYLIQFPASAQAEPYKRRLLESLLPNAVGRALTSGDRILARDLWNSEYYPATARRSLLGHLQHLAWLLPATLGTLGYRILAILKDKLYR